MCLQLGAAAALAAPVASLVMGQPLPAGALALSGAVLGGCGVVSYALWFYGRRYVGQLALVGDGTVEVLNPHSIIEFL